MIGSKLILVAINLFIVVAVQAGGVTDKTGRVVTGKVVLVDQARSENTSQVDLIFKVEGDGPYLKVRYAPNGFGFDAPRASESQLVPPSMTTDGTIAWQLVLHDPSNAEEAAACKLIPKRYRPGPDGKLILLARYTAPQNATKASLEVEPKVPCVIMQSWKRLK